MTDTTAAAIDKPLTFTQFEELKAIPRGEITMKASESGTWRHANGKEGYVVTSTIRALLERRLITVDPTFTDGVRRCRITQAGYAALSRAHHNRPKKRRR